MFESISIDYQAGAFWVVVAQTIFIIITLIYLWYSTKKQINKIDESTKSQISAISETTKNLKYISNSMKKQIKYIEEQKKFRPNLQLIPVNFKDIIQIEQKKSKSLEFQLINKGTMSANKINITMIVDWTLKLKEILHTNDLHSETKNTEYNGKIYTQLKLTTDILHSDYVIPFRIELISNKIGKYEVTWYSQCIEQKKNKGKFTIEVV